jgi:alpha-D-ribose 1-methylphosphonate 5-triphosphate synthase subunit PhnG
MHTRETFNSLSEKSTARLAVEIQPVVMNMDTSTVNDLLELLPVKDFIVKKEPATALVMVCTKDCFNTDFCLGEALVTEAVVEYDGKHGYAMVLGEDHTRALVIASLDAFFQGSDRERQAEIEHYLALASEEIIEKEERENKLVASTKVNFENMVKG